MLRKKLPKIWRIEKKLLSREHTEKQQRLEESSVQHDQESRTVSLLSETKYEDYKNYWYFWRFENLPWSGLTEQLWRTCVPHQALITSSSRKPSRDIGMLRNTREDMSITGNVFDCQHVRRDPDELRNDSRNLATLLGILRTEGIEKSESGEPLQSTPLSCSSNVQTKSLNGGKCLMFMTNRAVGIGTCVEGMTIPSYLSSKMHLQKFPDQTTFQSWIVNFRVEVCAKARNQWKGANSYTERKTWECFQRKTIGFCPNVDICNFLHTHATGRREKEVGDVKKSHLEQVFSSVPKVKEQTDVKNSNSLKASPVTWGKKSLSMVDKMKKDRHVILGIIPCVAVTSLETMHLWHSLPKSTCWWWEVTSARGREKKVLKEQLLFWGKKESKVVYLETQIQWILFYGKLENEIERFGGTHPEILRMHLVRIEFRERKGQSGGIIPKRWTSWAKSLRAQFWRNNTWGYLTVSTLWQQSSVELGEKKKYNAEQEGDLSSDKRGHFEKIQRP